MTPLFAAIAHGCAAEREAETFNEVYWPRIARGNENFAAAKLGLFGQELAALASFFEAPFTTPSPRLAAGRPRAGAEPGRLRLARARAPGGRRRAHARRRSSFEADSKTGNERSLASAGNLSELLVTIGRLSGEEGAVAAGEAAVAFADRSGDAFQRMAQRTTHADALLQAGAWPAPGRCSARPRRCRRRGSPACPASIRCKATDIAICCSPAAAPPKPPRALQTTR